MSTPQQDINIKYVCVYALSSVLRPPQQLNTRMTQLPQDTTAQSRNELITGVTTEKSWFESRDGQKIYLLLLNVQTGYGVNPASCSMDTGVHFQRVKVDGI